MPSTILVSADLAGALYMGGWSLAYPLVHLPSRSWSKLVLSALVSAYFLLLVMFIETPLYCISTSPPALPNCHNKCSR